MDRILGEGGGSPKMLSENVDVPVRGNKLSDNLYECRQENNDSARYSGWSLLKFIILVFNSVMNVIMSVFWSRASTETGTEAHLNLRRDGDELDELFDDSWIDVKDMSEALLSPDTMSLSSCDYIMRSRALANMIILRRLGKENMESSTRLLRLHACTWNVGQQPPDTHMLGFGEWLLGKQLMNKVNMINKAEGAVSESQFPVDEFPDIIVVSLQEVEMGGVVLVKEHTEVGVTWSEAIVDRLNQLGSHKVFYRKLKMVQLVGIVLIVVSRAKHVKYVANVRASITRTGAMRGVWGNKGSVGLRATIYGKRFLFIAAHFAAHQSNEKERRVNYRASLGDLCFEMPENVDDASEILDTFNNANGPEHSPVEKHFAWKRLFRGFGKSVSLSMENRVLDRHDYIFFLGDLNSRLHGVKGADIRRSVRRGEYDRLLCHDELRQGMISGEVFDGFQEALIAFPPTYKFDRETDIYDTSRKHRDPAWCDRILFRSMLPFDPEGTSPSMNRSIPTTCSPRKWHDGKSRNQHKPAALAATHTRQIFAANVLETQFPSADDTISLNHGLHAAEEEVQGWSSSMASPLPSGDVLEDRLLSGDLEPLPTFFAARPSTCRDRRFEAFSFAPNEIVAIGYQYVPHLRQSDHRPVCGQFDVRVLSLSKELIDDIMQEVRNGIAELYRVFFLSSWDPPPDLPSATFDENSNENENAKKKS